MTNRIPLDHLTSDQYDHLCDQLDALQAVARGYCPACGRGDAAPTVGDWEQQRQRAEAAETALERVRALVHIADSEDVTDWQRGYRACAERVDTALTEPGPGPAATQATEPARWLLAGTRDLSIPAPLTPAEEARLAQDGVDTPGCDCGHDGMGVSWHGDDCPWRRQQVDPTA